MRGRSATRQRSACAQVQALSLDSVIIKITAYMDADAVFPWLVTSKFTMASWRAQQGDQVTSNLTTHVRHFMHREETWQWVVDTGYVPCKQTGHVAARYGHITLLECLEEDELLGKSDMFLCE